MLTFGKGHDLKNLIVINLRQGATKTIALLAMVHAVVPKATKQAFYLALRQLLADQVVVKQGKEVSINLRYAEQVQGFLDDIGRNYAAQIKAGEQPLLVGTDKLIYKFSRLASLDSYLLHLFALIMKETPAASPIYLYNPFEWFLLATPEAELSYYGWLNGKGKNIYLVLGEEAPANRLVIDEYSRENLIMAIDGHLPFKENEFVIVLGDYVLVTKVKLATAQIINALCRDHHLSELERTEKIGGILASRLKAKLTIENNPAKAKKYKKLLARQFFVPKELREL